MSKFIHTPIGIKITSFLGWLLIRSINLTITLKVIGDENLQPVLKTGKPGIGALWHGRHFILVDKYRNKFINRKNICVMTSQSRDGELLSQILEKLKYKVVRGSSTRGGITGMIKLIDMMNSGYDTIVAVDGPRGPREKVKAGVIFLSEKTGLPIVPLTSSSKKYWMINSWDRYLIPKPFTTAIVIIGEPVYVSKNADHDEIQSKLNLLEKRLHEITQKADNYFTEG